MQHECYNASVGSAQIFALLVGYPRTFSLSHLVGEWLSLVEHLVRDQGVGGSNPLSPTNLLHNQRIADYENWNEPLGNDQGVFFGPFTHVYSHNQQLGD